jgi:hypothetical protein
VKKKRSKFPQIKIAERSKWRPVFVEWIDASGPAHNRWSFAGDLEREEGGGYRCRSIGYLIGGSRDHVTLAAHLGNYYVEDEDGVQFCGVMNIARGMILRLVNLPDPTYRARRKGRP